MSSAWTQPRLPGYLAGCKDMHLTPLCCPADLLTVLIRCAAPCRLWPHRAACGWVHPVRLCLCGWPLHRHVSLAWAATTGVRCRGCCCCCPLGLGSHRTFTEQINHQTPTCSAINPARVFGPALVFNCYWNTAFIYMAAQFCGGAIAALLAMPLWGPGPEFATDVHEQQALRSAESARAVAPAAIPAAFTAKAQAERQGLVEMQADGSSSGHWEARFG